MTLEDARIWTASLLYFVLLLFAALSHTLASSTTITRYMRARAFLLQALSNVHQGGNQQFTRAGPFWAFVLNVSSYGGNLAQHISPLLLYLYLQNYVHGATQYSRCKTIEDSGTTEEHVLLLARPPRSLLDERHSL